MYRSGTDPVPPMVSAWTRLIGWWDYGFSSAPSSGTWEAGGGANRAVYVPIVIPSVCVVRRVWWVNGSSVSATYNIDVGVYADAGGIPGAKLVSSGSTAQGTASNVQFADVTDTTLSPNLYWLAIACSSASATFFRNNSSAAWNASVRFMQETAFALPATATPVESDATLTFYLCGFATTSSP